MVKRIIFTVLLVLIIILYSCMALRPSGFATSLQDQDNAAAIQTGSAINAAGSSGRSVNASSVSASSVGIVGGGGTGGGSGSASGTSQNDADEDKEKKDNALKRFFYNLTPKSIQLSLTEKSDQVFKAWTIQQSVHGTINVLQTADTGNLSVKPGESLAPYNTTHKIISGMFLFAMGVIVFGKTLLSLSVPVVFLVVIPIIIVINIVALWKSKDNGVLRVVIAAIVTSLLVSLAVPIVMKASILIDDIVFSKPVNEIIVSLEESGSGIGRIETDLRSGRRSPAAIQNYTTSAKSFSDNVVKDSFSYILVYIITFILLPVFSGIGLCKLTRFISRKISKKG